MKKKIIIGILGTTLDQSFKASKRWDRWRPSVNMFNIRSIEFNSFEMLLSEGSQTLGSIVSQDIQHIHQIAHPESQTKPIVNQHLLEMKDPWDFEIVYQELLNWAKHFPFDTEKNDYYVHISTGSHIAQICLFLLVEARYLPAVLFQTSPGEDKGGTPSYRIIDLDLKQYHGINDRIKRAKTESQSFLKGGIETANPKFNQMIQEIEYLCTHSKAPILLSGATGVGKTQLARRIYELKKSKHLISGKFVEINCATLQGSLASSTLFGHKKGAFTGAEKDRDGLLKKAHKGLLFLDEVGELGLDEQAMLLRALEDKLFTPVGGDENHFSDFQIIAGTNRDLRKDIQSGKFREDLYARLNLWHYELPTLKQRLEDLAPNIDFELEKFSSEHQKQLSFNTTAKHKFLKFSNSSKGLWKGNFRDLSAAIERMGTFAIRGQILEEAVDQEISRLNYLWGANTETKQLPPQDQLLESTDWKIISNWEALDVFEQMQLESVVNFCQDFENLAQAGRALYNKSLEKLTKRNDSDRLRKYLGKFGLKWKDIFFRTIQ